MKLLLKALLLGVLSFVIAGQFGVRAQGFGGTPDPNRHMGAVTAVDATAKTITFHDRRADTDTTVKVTDDTKYTKESYVPLTSLAVGDIISAGGREELDPAATSVDAARINILAELPKAGAGTNPAQNRSVVGTILTTTPSLTIKTAAGTTVTVNTTDTTRVSKTSSAALADIAVGNNVLIETKADGADLDAVAVHIVPARMRRAGGQGGGGVAPGGPAVN
jgi:hypothetical protein